MKIGLSSCTIEPKLNHGHLDGIGVYTQHLYQHYLAAQHPVHPVVYKSLRKKWQGADLPATLAFPIPCSISAMTSLVPLYRVFNRNIEKQIDLFHSTDYRIPRFKHIPVVATLHDAIMLKNPEWCNPRMREFKNWLMKKTAGWADHYIAISQAMIPELVEFWGIDEKRISVVYNGISDYWEQPVSDAEKHAVLTRFQLKPDFLFFVGTLQPRKNIDRIIKAYKRLPRELQEKHPLVIVGKNGWQTTDLMLEIQELTDQKLGTWLQYITNEELRVLYQTAKVFLFPSLSEGFGIPILEAFASRVPVLTSNITSMPEVAGNAAYLVDPYCIEELTQGIQTLLTNQTLCDTLIEKGALRCQAFSWETCAAQTLAVYKKTV